MRPTITIDEDLHGDLVVLSSITNKTMSQIIDGFIVMGISRQTGEVKQALKVAKDLRGRK